MGTELYRRGRLPAEACLEQLNRAQPDLVRQVHLDYILAGAEVIETNTFGANHVRLAAHGLENDVHDLNLAAVRLAREAQQLTGQRVWVAGAIGPLGKPLAPLGAIAPEEAREAFREQAQALGEGGVDLLILETFTSLAEIREAITAAQAAAGDVPIVAQLTFTQDGRTLANETPEEVAQALAPLGLAAIGANCSVGSDHMLGVIEKMAAAGVTHLSALPNAGFPTYVNGRLVYLSSPAYMAERAGQMLDAGAAVIGGCCGTTPEHVAAMREMLKRHRRKSRAGGNPAAVAARSKEGAASPAAARPSLPVEPTALAKKLQAKEFVVTVEVHPPRGFHVEKTLLDLRKLLGRIDVDAFNCTDAPLAQGRMSALAMGSLIQSRLGVEAIMHVATRYRNLLALQSDLLGAHALGVRNVFVFMGDPPSMGDYPTSVSFSDITSSGLIRLITGANQGHDLNGKAIDEPASFLVGCALNLEPQDMDRELESLKRKVDAGAQFILSQVVFSPEPVERLHDRLRGFPVPLILGVLPLRSARHAEFLHNEVPGMVIPDDVRRRMQEAGDRGLQAGVQIAQELLARVRPAIAGGYMIPAFGRYDAVADVVSGLPDRAKPTG
jgi:homocysteine S-methyltransferase